MNDEWRDREIENNEILVTTIPTGLHPRNVLVVKVGRWWQVVAVVDPPRCGRWQWQQQAAAGRGSAGRGPKCSSDAQRRHANQVENRRHEQAGSKPRSGENVQNPNHEQAMPQQSCPRTQEE